MTDAKNDGREAGGKLKRKEYEQELKQYTSVVFGKRCSEAGARPSMGSVGDAYDNAMAESFFSTLEAELLSRRRFASQDGLL